MKYGRLSVLVLVAAVVLAPSTSVAHHAIVAKFDESKPMTLDGTVNMVDWKNPHVHVFLDVRRADRVDRWAIELESRVDLVRGGWSRESLRPGDAIKVQGIAARDGSRQLWGKSVILASNGKKVLDALTTAVPARTE